MINLIRSVHINGVEFNTNRDPQFYRRSVNEPFSIQLYLTGTGRADATLEIEIGRASCRERVLFAV